MIKQALQYLAHGLSVIPITGRTKEPTVSSWKDQQSSPYSEQEAKIAFNNAKGIAVVCGIVSGGLTVLDIDCKVNPQKGQQFMDDFFELCGKDIANQYIVETQSKGYHIYYRNEVVDGNKHIAKLDEGVLIETRGQGGYVAAPPTPKYKVISGKPSQIPVWDNDFKEAVWSLAYSYNEVQEEKADFSIKKHSNTTHKVSVLDDYDQDDHWITVLTDAGWEMVDKKGPKVFWRRPGSENKQSANWHTEHRKFYVFTPNTEFEAGQAYSPCAIYAYIRCNKDFTQAARELAEMNYGKAFDEHDRKNIDEVRKLVKQGYTDEQIKDIAKYQDIDRYIEVAREDDKKKNKQEWVMDYVRDLKLRFNGVTRKIEKNGIPLTDRDINSIIINAQMDNPKVSMGLVEKALMSNAVQEYHPIREYFDKIKHIKYDNEIERLFNTLSIVNVDDIEHMYRLFKKWLLQLVASPYGYPAELALVLVGGQNTGKTTFFTSLLPKGIAKYFTTDTLTQGKDSEIIMTETLLVLDDEWGGQSKREAEYFKSLLSRTTFKIRRPYGRVMEDLQRLAVICGTSNNNDVINDPTGNRRVLPIEIVSRDFAASQDICRDALFAEMLDIFRTEGVDCIRLTQDDRDYLSSHSQSHQTVNEVQERILAHFVEGNKSDLMTATDVCDIINRKSEGQKLYPVWIGRELRNLGFMSTRRTMRGKKATYWLIKERIYDDPLDDFAGQNLEKDEDLPF